MPVLTRSARAALVAEGDGATLSLRESVTAKADAVWRHRGERDLYTGSERATTLRPQVDHVLEVQLGEMALVRAFTAERGAMASMATAHATELLRGAINDVRNLNVTSAKINQAKRGPFTAALNRLRSDTLRSVSIEQLVRQGRGVWMLHDGTWARVGSAVVASYDAMDDSLRGGGVDAPREAAALVESSLDELRSMLTTLGFE